MTLFVSASPFLVIFSRVPRDLYCAKDCLVRVTSKRRASQRVCRNGWLCWRMRSPRKKKIRQDNFLQMHPFCESFFHRPLGYLWEHLIKRRGRRLYTMSLSQEKVPQMFRVPTWQMPIGVRAFRWVFCLELVNYSVQWTSRFNELLMQKNDACASVTVTARSIAPL